MSPDLALWSALALLSLLGLPWLWGLRLQLELAVNGSTSHEQRGLRVDAGLSLGPVRLQLEREPAAGRVVSWRLLLCGRRLLEGARLLEAGATSSTIEDRQLGTAAGRGARRWTLELAWLDAARWLGRQGRRLRITRLDGRAAVGLEDPASTGALYGLLCTLHALSATGARIEVWPVFDRALLDVDARAALDLQLLPVLGSAAWLVVTHLHRAPAVLLGQPMSGAVLPSSPGA